MATPPRGRKLGCALLAIAALAAFVGLMLSTAGPFRSVSGRGVPASEANARLWNCLVPDDATDVWYTSSYRATRVECTLGPEGFEAWCHRQGWRTSPITEDEPAFVTSERGGLRTIGQGLRFREMNGDLGFFGLYDVQGRRAFVTYSGN